MASRAEAEPTGCLVPGQSCTGICGLTVSGGSTCFQSGVPKQKCAVSSPICTFVRACTTPSLSLALVTMSSFSEASSVSILAVTFDFCPIVSPWVVHNKRVMGILQHTRVLIPSYGSDRDGDSATGIVLSTSYDFVK